MWFLEIFWAMSSLRLLILTRIWSYAHVLLSSAISMPSKMFQNGIYAVCFRTMKLIFFVGSWKSHPTGTRAMLSTLLGTEIQRWDMFLTLGAEKKITLKH